MGNGGKKAAKQGAGTKKPGRRGSKAAKPRDPEPEPPPPPPPPPDPAVEARREAAAVQLQRAARVWLAGREAAKAARRRRLELEREDAMARAAHDAWVLMVTREREAEERKMVALAEEKRVAREKAKQEAALREAAFEGDQPAVVRLLRSDIINVDCKDANNNTALLEAGGGGHPGIITVLVAAGADVNARGKYQRTALYRAAFNGKAAAVSELLDAGCDPRLFDADGSRPIDIAATDECRALLEAWDMDATNAR